MAYKAVLITTFIVCQVFSGPVKEITHQYKCKEESQDVKLDLASTFSDCEQTWKTQEKPIANLLNGTVECQAPCNEVTHGRINIQGCPNLTLTIFCDNPFLSEHRHHFVGMQVKDVPKHDRRSNYGVFVSLVLLTFVVLLICCFRKESNVGLNLNNELDQNH